MSVVEPRPVACVVGDSTVLLWGIGGAERLHRQLRAAGVDQVCRGLDDTAVGAAASVLLLRADYVFDDRVIGDLIAAPTPVVLRASAGGPVAALKVAHEELSAAAAIIAGAASPTSIPQAGQQTPDTLSSAFSGTLKKTAPPLVLHVAAGKAAEIERYLFDGSYKGTTDLVTKWVWPTLARWVTGLCTRLGIVPNAVTSVSLLLAVLVIVLFARGHIALGLVLAWIMTFLDTVDGKLARVTVTSTQFGHFFDHLIDLIHPPLWYAAWAVGATEDLIELSMWSPLLTVMLVAYVAGRLLEGFFKEFVAGFTMFVWRPFDSYFRLILARRNPCLLLLTASFILGWADLGLRWVIAWTVISTVVVAVRVLQAAWARLRGRKPRPWLEEIRADAPDAPLWWRPFAPNTTILARLTRE